ncbi:hypothetical protein BCR39DRAFT_495759 [Naematelia encephala]|uniref:Zn(2)-C6 fungal-type domain-containing protein n=1 Tax=Naematelia encephala TaxID=71784 RepID=A0A1Y2B2C6_9TREE|nr:hypothetical protein BCR39DRAFT_495759 [Naematelia encephala]
MSASMSSNDEQQDQPKISGRNTACLQCRKRKLKCNGLRPICTNCAKPRTRGLTASEKLNPPQPKCTWNGSKDTRRTRIVEPDGNEGDGSRKRGRLTELEDGIDTFEKALRAQGTPVESIGARLQSIQEAEDHIAALSRALYAKRNPSSEFQSSGGWGDSIAHEGFPGFAIESTSTIGSDRKTGISSPAEIFQTESSTEATALDPLDYQYLSGQPTHVPKTSDGSDLWFIEDSGRCGDDTVVRQDWPRELPPINTVEHILDVFFDKVATWPKMLRKSVLKQNLRLPPSHYRFPARPLLHAILCITASFLPSAALTNRSYWPIGTAVGATAHPETDQEIQSVKQQAELRNVIGAMHASGQTSFNDSSILGRFQCWHRRQALELSTIYIDKGQAFLQLLQAAILVTASDQLNASWGDLWLLAGSCIRSAIPMRIYQSSAITSNDLMGIGSAGCPAAADPLEQAEMDRTWWMAYLMERSASVWTTWPSSMADDEITCELPVLQSTYDQGYGDLIGVQSIHTPDLYSDHPPRHIDSFTFFIKAVKLFADTQRFFRFYQRQNHSIHRYLDQPGLRLLISQVNSFRLSLPAHMRKPTQELAVGQLDRDMLAAVLFAHATSVALGEPLVTKATWQHDIARMSLGAIRAILSLLYDITATSYDLTLLPASCSYVFLHASKGLMRFVDAANQVGDAVSASVFRSEIGVFNRMVLRQYGERFPLGAQHAKMLEGYLSEQETGSASTAGHVTTYTVDKLILPERPPGSMNAVSGSIDNVTTPLNDTTSSSGFTPHTDGTGISFSTGLGKSASTAPTSVSGDPLLLNFSGSVGPSLAPMSALFTSNGGMEFNLDNFLMADSPNQGVVPSTSTDWFDVSNFSFDSQQVSELFGSTSEEM